MAKVTTNNYTKINKVSGFRASGISSGIKMKKEKDLALIVSDDLANVAGVFTENKVKAAPVLIDLDRVKKGKSRGVIINSGCANVSVGKYGMIDAKKVITSLDKTFALGSGKRDENFLICSTGVIGERMPAKKVTDSMTKLITNLSSSGFKNASEAIMTTDAYAKTCGFKVNIGGAPVSILGVAKGAGMICPNMATMLCFFMTDANISSALLKKALKDAVGASFNRITVDGDTSTNDTVLVFANGASAGKSIKAGSSEYKKFSKMLTEISINLSHQIVKDGEGASKFIEVIVKGAKTNKDAENCARTIANSPLVKTAFFGEDPNWGRIMAAIGRSGAYIKQEKINIAFNNILVARGGVDAGNEKKSAREMKKKEIILTVDLGLNKLYKNSYKMWTTDLGHQYIKINADYRS